MVYAPGGGRGPLPLPVAIGFVLIGPLLLWFSYKSATTDPMPVIVSCTRERADLIACQPGNVRGAQALARTQTGKNARTCFALDDKWMQCGGDVQSAAARVNALPVGAKADVDLTPAKESVPSMLVGVALGLVMIVVGIHRLFTKSKVP